MQNDDRSSNEQLRGSLRDYYGTAMFNGNPMAMMELEEAERASSEELRQMARSNGIDPEPHHRGLSEPLPSAARPYQGGRQQAPAETGISVSVSTQTIGPAATRFFNSDYPQHDTGFFSKYGQALGHKAREGGSLPAETTEV